jgi:small basic protein (TIGR04137 family)
LPDKAEDVVEVSAEFWYASRVRASFPGVGGGRLRRRKGQHYMSLHRSLLAGRRAGKHRNVLTREERIVKLEEDGRWNESGSSVFGLPKVRSIKPVAGKKAKKKEDAAEAAEGAEGAEGTVAAEGAPAEGAK